MDVSALNIASAGIASDEGGFAVPGAVVAGDAFAKLISGLGSVPAPDPAEPEIVRSPGVAIPAEAGEAETPLLDPALLLTGNPMSAAPAKAAKSEPGAATPQRKSDEAAPDEAPTAASLGLPPLLAALVAPTLAQAAPLPRAQVPVVADSGVAEPGAAPPAITRLLVATAPAPTTSPQLAATPSSGESAPLPTVAAASSAPLVSEAIEASPREEGAGRAVDSRPAGIAAAAMVTDPSGEAAVALPTGAGPTPTARTVSASAPVADAAPPALLSMPANDGALRPAQRAPSLRRAAGIGEQELTMSTGEGAMRPPVTNGPGAFATSVPLPDLASPVLSAAIAPIDAGVAVSALPQPTAAPMATAPAELAVERQLDVARDGAWLDQLATDIVRTAGSDASLRFRLNPETLGTLHVEISHGHDGASVRLTADTEQARTLIADARPQLVAEARAQGVRIAEAHVDLGGQGQSQSHAQAGNGGRDGREASSREYLTSWQPESAEEEATPSRRSTAERYA